MEAELALLVQLPAHQVQILYLVVLLPQEAGVEAGVQWVEALPVPAVMVALEAALDLAGRGHIQVVRGILRQ